MLGGGAHIYRWRLGTAAVACSPPPAGLPRGLILQVQVPAHAPSLLPLIRQVLSQAGCRQAGGLIDPQGHTVTSLACIVESL